MDDCISRQKAIDLANYLKIEVDGYHQYNQAIGCYMAELIRLPSALQLLEDGTLIVTVPNLSAVHRVIVDEENSRYCKTFYQDGDEDDKPVYDCMTCRHADRMPGIYPCSECNVAYEKPPSKWEKKEG